MTSLIEEFEDDDSLKDKYLIFTLEKDEYAIEISHVIEIIEMQHITTVPEFPDYVRGVINLRGKIIPVMDVRQRFKKDLRQYDDRTCIIIIQMMDISMGLIIDRVSEVINISGDNIQPPPQISTSFSGRFIKAIGRSGSNVKLVLDCDKLLNQEEVDELSQAIE